MTAFFTEIPTPYALTFAGQGSSWRPALTSSLSFPPHAQMLRTYYAQVRELLAPVAADLLTSAPGSLERLNGLMNGDTSDLPSDASPSVSVPGITFAQLGALADLDATQLDIHTSSPVLLGHSQGILGAEVARAWIARDDQRVTHVLALAVLIGTAAQSLSVRLGATKLGDATPMLSVRGLPCSMVSEALDAQALSLAVVNGPRSVVLSGRPDDLQAFRHTLESRVAAENRALEEHLKGGTPLEAIFEFLPVAAPFHSEMLEEAVAQVAAWTRTLAEAGHSIDDAEAERVARAILVERDDWSAAVASAVSEGVKVFIDLGPSNMLTRLTQDLLDGTGAQIVDASTNARRTELDETGSHYEPEADWSRFAPKVVALPDGRHVVSTAFTRLTGRSPIVLPGMTPTTVGPRIVAAAANAGHWAEMAGGGQYSEEVFTEHRLELQKLLEPGRSAGFNTMFFDRFMWNLQFGVNRIVPKARRAGAPIDAVTIAAGIPELDEARELIAQLRADGFEYLCLKPGTVEQIEQVLRIARANPEHTLIIQVEDGHSGGHHSWENLDDLLLATYGHIRRTPNVVLAVGGGIGSAADAARYITGQWSVDLGSPAMPVDAVLVGTASMATLEAETSPQVKQLLKDTPGVGEDGWVGSGKVRGGMTSGLSHLGADMHEIENSSARASRLIHEVGSDLEAINARRDELIEAMNKTAKPYFGELSEMTYAEWARRVIDLSYPWADWTWTDRALDLFHRIESRLNTADHGDIPTLFESREDLEDGQAALSRLLEAYPQAETTRVVPADVAWFPVLCRKHHKPMPFVPVLDGDLARWWGTDTLWQSQDARFDADAVRIIPGPRSVAGIDRVNEPIGEMFARFEQAVVDALAPSPAQVPHVWSRFHDLEDAASFLREISHIQWAGNLVDNPAYTSVDATEILHDEAGYSIRIHCDSMWDQTPNSSHHSVEYIDIPVLLSSACMTGAYPVVDMSRLSVTAYDLLAGAAGVGTTTVNGDHIEKMPAVIPGEGFGTVRDAFTFTENLGFAHGAVTGGALSTQLASGVPDALVGPCWPAIYAALGSAMYQGVPVIEGLVNAVHLDHSIFLDRELPPFGSRVEVEGRCAQLAESSAGRVVRVELELSYEGEVFARMVERFAIRGRIASTQPPAPAPEVADSFVDTPRSFLRHVRVQAPENMTAFAIVSGDFNPIHTSYAAARLSGLSAPLVHGMWLSATVQHTLCAHSTQPVDSPDTLGVIRSVEMPEAEISAWSYRMFGMVQLNDIVDITIERIGRIGGELVLEATCRIGDEVVSIARARTRAPRTAYVYPGQGIQRQMMGLEHMSATARSVWAQADAHTRKALGFSIESIVRTNPTELRVGSEIFRHPKGVLNLTQFTQVALATLAYAQTEELRADGAFEEHAFYAGHSLGEYTALSAYAQIFPLEQVLEIVFQRGSAMHHLVERDAQGRSNYAMGALRPNQFGMGDAEVRDYVASIAEKSGEFLEIVNYNLAGSQYSVAGSIAGLKALEADTAERARAHGGRRALIMIPGIDVPFHSSRLRAGVPAFRDKLDSLLPESINLDVLQGRYIPNLVARPFELSRDFAQSILEVVPSEATQKLVDNWDEAEANPQSTARTLLIELLSWQFASPVRWIETQDLLFSAPPKGLGVERLVEIGLASSPTLANMASKTLSLPAFAQVQVDVLNVERDSARARNEDAVAAPERAQADSPASADEAAPAESAAPASAVETPAVEVATAAPAAPAPAAAASGTMPELPLSASDAIRILLAFSNKLLPEQIEATDTVETLTNGVSSKRNQLLMDMAAELSVSTIDGAAEASMGDLFSTIDSLVPSYAAFGPVLSDAINSKLRKIFGSAGLPATFTTGYVKDNWGLSEQWAARVNAEILLGTRDGDSIRGGSLSTLPGSVSSAKDASALIDQALALIAAREGLTLSRPSAGGSAGGEVVDSAALRDLESRILGDQGILATQARDILKALGLADAPVATEIEDSSSLIAAVEAELGANWEASVRPAFDERRAVLLDDRWATAREDLARILAGSLEPTEVPAERLRGGGQSLSALASWYAAHTVDADLKAYFTKVSEAALEAAEGRFTGDVAVVTGAAPHSIAAAVVGELLAGGATVIMTSSRVNDARLAFAKELYRTHANMDAALWVVPANMASFRDVDALISWVGSEQTETHGATTEVVKPALLPDLFVPFAAPRVSGTLGSDPQGALAQERLLLWSVERAIHLLAGLGADTAPDHRTHVLLPGSPNRGIFGGDGAYGEAKAAFDAIATKWEHESGWPTRTTIAHPLIGWVQGTSLMGGNDVLVPAAEAAGVHVYTTEEIAGELAQLLTREVREQALSAPVHADLTGGLADAGLDLPALARQAREQAAASAQEAAEQAPASVRALPNPHAPALAAPLAWDTPRASLRDQIVIVGTGEIGTWGSGRTRQEAEFGEDFDLTAAGVLEMAWMMKLITWSESPQPGWYDASGTQVDEAEIYDRFRDEVVARSGIRRFNDDSNMVDCGSNDVRTVFLTSEQTFTVDTKAEAEDYVLADPSHTTIWEENGTWHVTKSAGSPVQVPARATLTRTVGGQIPQDFDPAQWGIPASMVEALDRIAVWNLVTAVDAFISSGFSPAELLQAVHPADVSSTQGTGIGGMESLRHVFLSRFLGEDRPQDILQEALPNVVAAHTMQSFIGGYGQMIHSVGACATAAVSIEEAVDKIRLGKSDFVVAGGIDDISVESLTGFGNMNATAESAALEARGITPRHFSRAGDRRRAGFLEAAGGGTLLVTRGDIAADLGLPVQAVVAYARSFADGAHTSIPAPGLGALAAARGGRDSALAHALADLGLSADDIAVVSKHDTSTRANDPNEAELHSRLSAALGRSEGNPLYVVSQKTLTGHAKGGAALFQAAGLIDIFRRQEIPANRSLDCLDPDMAQWMPLLWLRKPLDVSASPVRAGVLTSLGFGHIAAMVVLAHPGAFEAALLAERGEAALAQWRERAQARLEEGRRHLDEAMIGRAELFVPIEGRRLPADRTHEAEVALLLDPSARLGADGTYAGAEN